MSRVLVVDDDPDIRLVLQELLTEEGYQVETASDGLTALGLLHQAPLPDIILLDLAMPGMNGGAVVKAIRSDPALRGIPVVIVTGSVPDAFEYPPDGSYQGLIGKPFDINDVLEIVRGLLESPFSARFAV